MLNILDLFSGIGGFSLGLERTGGFRTVAFCEQNAYAAAVLAHHWPGIPCFGDVRDITAASLAARGIPRPHLVCGGFPCQDISLAGLGAGLAGARSGLWFEMLRIIAETRPEFVIAENVSALRSRGLDVVLGSLASIGYDAEWHCIPASAVGAPHRRDRVWIVAYPGREQHEGGSVADGWAAAEIISAPDTDGEGEHDGTVDAEMGGASEPMADAKRQLKRLPRGSREMGGAAGGIGGEEREQRNGDAARGGGSPVADTAGKRSGEAGRFRRDRLTQRITSGGQVVGTLEYSEQWSVEPDVGRVADGVPSRVDRLARLGNAVVPQIPEIIGRAILASLHV